MTNAYACSSASVLTMQSSCLTTTLPSPMSSRSVADGEDAVSLAPGANVLRFRAAPVKAGLYAARGIAARLGGLRLSLPLLPPERLPGLSRQPGGATGTAV